MADISIAESSPTSHTIEEETSGPSGNASPQLLFKNSYEEEVSASNTEP